MSEPLDIAVDLGAVPEPLPAMVPARELIRDTRPAPPQIVHGVLHQTCKMLLSGTSKSNKSWSLLDLAVSVASGQKWWGHQCEEADVVYLNFELPDWGMRDRLGSVLTARPECKGCEDRLFFWNLRGHNTDLALLRPKLEEQLCRRQFGLIILDPIYKLLGDRDENSNGEIAGLMNEVEAFCQRYGAAVAIAHHFAKGDSTAKNAIDRMSGAGVWARDPDSLVTLTPHEEDDCFSVNMTLRNLPRMPEFVLRWDYPLMRVASDLNPGALRRPQGRNKACSDREFVELVLENKSLNNRSVVNRARECFRLSEASTNRYLARLKAAGLICHSGGLYWAAHQEVTPE
jgi:hypothetical protein